MSKLFRLFSVLALLFVLFVLLLVLFEFFLRAFNPQPSEYEFSQVYSQNSHEKLGLKEKVIVERNKLGLRSVGFKSQLKADNTIRVVCLGGASTEQVTQNIEDTWMGLLESRVRVDFPSINFEFGSYARADAGMHYVLKWANTELEGLSPDIVISKFGLYSLRTDESLVANGVDFENLKHYIESEPTGIRYRVMHTSHLARWVDVLYQKRKINNFYDSLAGKNPALVFLPQQKQQYWKAPMYQGEPKISNRLFGKKTIYLARKVKEIGARHIMLGQPLLYHPDMEYQQSGEEVRIISNSASIKERLASIHLLIDDGKEMLRLSPRAFLSEMKRFNQMQERVAQREGVLYVGLEDLTGKSENFYDDFMFTDTGSKQVSELVYPILKEEVKEVLAGRTNQIFQ